MSISSTGNGLSILIACDFVPHHDWMAFLCWYSITKNLPDAKVAVVCNRQLMISDAMAWPKRCKVPLRLHKTVSPEEQIEIGRELLPLPMIVAQPDMVCVRDFEESGFSLDSLQSDKPQKIVEIAGLCCDVKNEQPCVFVTYPNGWGKFVASSWIHKMSHPFTADERYKGSGMTANEIRLGRLWSAVPHLYQAVSRG